MNLSRTKKAFFAIILFNFAFLSLVAINLSISYREALLFFQDTTIVGFLANISCDILGHNNFALRLPFVIIATFNLLLMFYISKDYFRYEKDRIYNLLIFACLPGVVASSILLNEASLVIFLTLLYISYFKKFGQHNYILLFIFVFIDNSFLILFLALCLYSFIKKEYMLMFVSCSLFILSIYIFGFEVGGRPRGYFLETIGIFATIFSPLLFLYFFYTLYSVPLRNEKNLLWYIAFIALVVAIMFSFRQKIYVQDFAPFVVIATPFMMKHFLSSMRVRLPEFRSRYYIGSLIVIGVLVLNTLSIGFSQIFYLFLKNPHDHFAIDYSFASQIADSLKAKSINSIKVADDNKLQLRLKFYNIAYGEGYVLHTKIDDIQNATIKFNLLGKNIYGVNVTKLNTK